MNDANPYASPRREAKSLRSFAQCPALPKSIRTPPIVRLALVFTTTLSIAGVGGGLLCAHLNWDDRVLLGFSVLVVVFAVFAIWISIKSFFTTVLLTRSGIKIYHMRQRTFDWSVIKTWKQQSNGTCVELKTIDGETVSIQNMATNRLANDMIAATLNKYVGPPS